MRKVLSFVLVLSLVLGSFSMAFAAGPATGLSDIDGIANEDAIQVAYDLGIVTGNPDGTYLPAKAVNRAEFAAMITRALAIPDSALTGYTTTTFKDTVGYGWAVPYLAFCQSKGIMLGDGQGNAMPGRTISVNEAVTMALRAVGYTANSAELVGAWPSNYVTLAQNLDLYDDVSAVTSVDKANAAQIIYNLLTVQKVAVNADGETKLLETGNPKVAATLLNTGLGATAWTAARVIEGDEDSSINLRAYHGAAVIAYEKKDVIIAIGEVKSTFLTVDEVVSATKFETSDDKEYTYVANTTGYAIFANGGTVDLVTSTAFSAAVGDKIAVELKGRTIDKLWSVQTWVASDRVEFEEEMLDDESLNGWDFTLDDDDEIDYNTFELRGAKNLDAIKKDNVVEIYVAANDKITRVDVGTETVTGKVTKIDDNEYTIAGKDYKIVTGVNAPAAPVLGDSGTASLNYSGKIAFWDIDDATSGNYAMVTGIEPAAAGSTLAKDKIQLVNKEGKEVVYEVKNSDAYDTGVTIGAFATDDLVKFSLDKNGRIDDILELSKSLIGSRELSKSGSLLGGLTVDSGVVVFVKDGTDYTVAKLADVAKEEALTGSYYAESKVKVLIVDADDISGADAVYGVINKVVPIYNADDDEVQYVTALVGGKEVKYYTDADDTVTYTSAAGIYKFNIDSNGVITKATAVTATSTGIQAYKAITEVMAKDGSYLVKDASDWYSLDSSVKVYTYDISDGEFDTSNVGAIKAPGGGVASGSAIQMYQVDKDSEQYDIVVILLP